MRSGQDSSIDGGERGVCLEVASSGWLSDTAHVPVLEAWLFLAAIMDPYTRQIASWAMSDRMAGDSTVTALKQAIQRRQPRAGLIDHLDKAASTPTRPRDGE
jgi:putative transposase